MRALRSYGEKDIRVVDVDEPTPSDDKVIIDVEWCGICGSDLHLYHLGAEAMLRIPKDRTDAHPLIMGHEIAGRVMHSPTPATIPVGAAVVLDPRLYCGGCGPCTAAPEPQTQCCANGISFAGFSTRVGGGFAERLAVAPEAVHVLPEGDGGGLDDAALVEPLAVAWHAVKRAGIAPPAWLGGDGEGGGKTAAEVSALVVGGGPVGVAVCYVLRAWGVGKVVLSEPAAERREGIRGLVDDVMNPVAENVAERCLKMTGGRGMDAVFECSGSPRVMGDVFGSVGFRSVVVVVALWTGDVPVPFVPLMYRECVITSSCAYNEKDFKEVVNAFAEGKFKGVASMITARISLEDIVEKGFEVLDSPNNRHVKILITPKETGRSVGIQ